MPKSRYTTYWANTSSNSLVGRILREGDRKIKEKFEILLRGESIRSEIDKHIFSYGFAFEGKNVLIEKS